MIADRDGSGYDWLRALYMSAGVCMVTEGCCDCSVLREYAQIQENFYCSYGTKNVDERISISFVMPSEWIYINTTVRAVTVCLLATSILLLGQLYWSS